MSVDFTLSAAVEQSERAAAPFHRWELAAQTNYAEFFRLSDERYLLRFAELADFVVSRDGASVEVIPTPAVSRSTVEHLCMNQVLPLALSRQRALVIHASAVSVDSRAVAFVAESGRGKSTLAASFSTNGAELLTDDGLRLEWSSKQLLAHPNHPSIRLWGDSLEAVIEGEFARGAQASYSTKSRVLADGQFPFRNRATPLSKIYFLGEGVASNISLTPLTPSEALIQLVRHSFLLDIEERQMLAWHFDEVAKLAQLPIFFALDYPRRFDQLSRLRDAIISHSTA
ncbi:MAG: hypothetical protein ACRDAM_22505 [Casimicrobium sp.]